MKPINELLHQEGFLKNLFESIPCGVLIVDRDRRIQAVNNVLVRALGISDAKAIDKRAGEALSCIHAFKSQKGCGFSDECETCQVRNTALKALDGREVHRNKVKVQLLAKGEVRDLVLLVSAAPVEHEGESFAIVMIEEITELNRLRHRLKI